MDPGSRRRVANRSGFSVAIAAAILVSGCGQPLEFDSASELESRGQQRGLIERPVFGPGAVGPGGGTDTGVDGFRAERSEYIICASRGAQGQCVDAHLRFRAICVRPLRAFGIDWTAIGADAANSFNPTGLSWWLTSPLLRRPSTYTPLDLIYRPQRDELGGERPRPESVAILERTDDGRHRLLPADPSGVAQALVAKMLDWQSPFRRDEVPPSNRTRASIPVNPTIELSVPFHQNISQEELTPLLGRLGGCESGLPGGVALLEGASASFPANALEMGLSPRLDFNLSDSTALSSGPGLFLINRCGQLRASAASEEQALCRD